MPLVLRVESTITNLLIAIDTLLQLVAVSQPRPGQLIDLHFEEFLPGDDDEDNDNDDDYDDDDNDDDYDNDDNDE